ncbi:zinc finger protein 345-like isoform X1 [Eurosta solidaginis]|uniref:zinc finger protein 345-like isoform X1 n=1 Tax=Eurosta solidaginis TaxID=178769 RepID=UPI003530EC24
MDKSGLYIDYLCRTCMIKLEAFTSEGSTEPQHQSIFETMEECDELRIADLLTSTIPQIVEAQLSDELPKKICCKCLHQLISVYRFQKLCLQSDHKMRELVSKKWNDLNMSMMEAAIKVEVLPNGTDSYPLRSCQAKCTAQNSTLSETETALEAIESESAQWSTAEHLLKNEQLLDDCENSQDELSEFIKNEPIEDDEENTECSDTIHSTFVTKAEFTTEEQKVTVPYKNTRDKNYQYQYPCDICGRFFKTKLLLKRHKRIHSDEKPHKCDFCEKRFVQTANLREHMRTHTGEKPYKCKYCDRCFASKKQLHKHLRIHMGDNTYRCECCPLAFRLASELRLHSTTHKDEDPEARERNMKALMEIEAKLKQHVLKRYKNRRDKNEQYQNPCDICGKHFTTKPILNRHKLCHSDEKPHKCQLCEMRFVQATTLNQHMRTHTGEKPYKCKYCDLCFAAKGLLNKHLRVHLGDNIHRCESCPLAFHLASEIRLHSTTHKDEDPETRERNMAALREEEAKLKVNSHGEEKLYKCPHCPLIYGSSTTLSRHKSLHKGQQCDVCGKIMSEKALVIHKFIHSGEKPHKCGVCEMRFRQTQHLRRHMRTHTGERPFQCKYCDRAFARRCVMMAHLRTHLGQNVYRCQFCPLAFPLASKLRLHLTTHKNEDAATRKRNMKDLMEEEAKLIRKLSKKKIQEPSKVE